MPIISSAIPLPTENIDTDQIIPARFLLGVTKAGFGEQLFADQKKAPDFIFNQPQMTNRQILVAGHNFGCGSSREHAAWALDQAGIKVIISSLFSDIFKSNVFKNGLLPITVSPTELAQLFAVLTAQSELKVEIDLAGQRVHAGELQFSFEIDAFRKKCLLAEEGDLEFMLHRLPYIDAFEERMKNK